jgi:hypothetical protein
MKSETNNNALSDKLKNQTMNLKYKLSKQI